MKCKYCDNEASGKGFYSTMCNDCEGRWKSGKSKEEWDKSKIKR